METETKQSIQKTQPINQMTKARLRSRLFSDTLWHVPFWVSIKDSEITAIFRPKSKGYSSTLRWSTPYLTIPKLETAVSSNSSNYLQNYTSQIPRATNIHITAARNSNHDSNIMADRLGFGDIIPPSCERDQRLPYTSCLNLDTRVKETELGAIIPWKWEQLFPVKFVSNHQVRRRHIAAEGNFERSNLKREDVQWTQYHVLRNWKYENLLCHQTSFFWFCYSVCQNMLYVSFKTIRVNSLVTHLPQTKTVNKGIICQSKSIKESRDRHVGLQT
jgi:hypothetical protein